MRVHWHFLPLAGGVACEQHSIPHALFLEMFSFAWGASGPVLRFLLKSNTLHSYLVVIVSGKICAFNAQLNFLRAESLQINEHFSSRGC